MTDRLTTNLAAFEKFLAEKGWSIWEQKDIEYGRQVVITDGSMKLPVNFYTSGKILPQGKSSDLKTAVTEWANLIQAGLLGRTPSVVGKERKNRTAKYLVIPDKISHIRDEVIAKRFDNSLWKEPSGPAELYRAEIHHAGQRVTVTQYGSGTLIVQGLSGECFDLVCDELDEHLSQSFAARAERFIEGETQRTATTAYLESAEAENDAARWLFAQLDKKVYDFMHSNDQRTLLSAVGVRNALQKSGQPLEDYSVVVMPFAKAYEGFLIRLAEQLGLVNRDTISHKADAIVIGAWLEAIKARLPDPKRYSEVSDALSAAWSCRNKSIHSDFANPLSTLKSFPEADHEIGTILRAMGRAHRVFVVEGVNLLPPQDEKAGKPKPSEPEPVWRFAGVDQNRLRKQLAGDGLTVEDRLQDPKNVWSVVQRPSISIFALRDPQGEVIVKGKQAEEFCRKYAELLTPALVKSSARIGVDESGKGDLFGPLVVVGVVLTPDTEVELAKRGVRDSKSIADSQIPEVAALVRKLCTVEAVTLLPPDYNQAYEQHGRNLNRLLAWGHAQVIARLNRQTGAARAISDQFGDESLLVNALAAENCAVELEQRPKAESDIAVAAASVVARAEFIAAINDYSAKAGVEIPLGASAREVKEIGKRIYKRWGKRGLERIAKMHFKTIAEIVAER